MNCYLVLLSNAPHANLRNSPHYSSESQLVLLDERTATLIWRIGMREGLEKDTVEQNT